MTIASSWSCVTNSVVMPRSLWILRISICRFLRRSASIADSGSSRSSTLGSTTSARASATRCCWPPESERGYWSYFSERPTTSSISLTFVSICAFGIFCILRPNATFCATVMFGNRLYCWKTMPQPRFLGLTSVTSLPSRKILPEVTSSRPDRQRRSVDFPQPDGPRKVTSSPCSISSVMSFRTWFVPKYLLICSK